MLCFPTRHCFWHMSIEVKMLKPKQLSQNPRLLHLHKIRDILCKEIPKYEPIFNGQHPDHCNNVVTDTMWEKILMEVKNKNIIIMSKYMFNLHATVLYFQYILTVAKNKYIFLWTVVELQTKWKDMKDKFRKKSKSGSATGINEVQGMKCHSIRKCFSWNHTLNPEGKI